MKTITFQLSYEGCCLHKNRLYIQTHLRLHFDLADHYPRVKVQLLFVDIFSRLLDEMRNDENIFWNSWLETTPLSW